MVDAVRRKCFVSYHHDEDQVAVDRFIRTFDHYGDIFIHRGLGISMAQDVIDSNDTDYVMSRIKQLYLTDSTVTIVMMGRCTWARRYVDWELQATLRQSLLSLPNGLLGIKLPTFTQFPERFSANLKRDGDADSYAGFIDYPGSFEVLQNAIEWAFNRRTTHARYIRNSRERFGYNKQC